MSPSTKDTPGPASSITAAEKKIPAANPFLAEKAAAIHQLLKRTRENIIEIGQHLVETRDHVDRGEWLAWLDAEFGWSDQTAYRFIHVYELSRDATFHTLVELDLPLGVLYQLAAPKAEAARVEIAERAEAGEKISSSTVKDAIARAKGTAVENFKSPERARADAALQNDVDAPDSGKERGEYYATAKPKETPPDHVDMVAPPVTPAVVVPLWDRVQDTPPTVPQGEEIRAADAGPTVEEAEAEVRRLKALKAAINANMEDDTKIDAAASAKVLAEFEACCTRLQEMCGDDLQRAIDHFAEAVELPATDLMPDVKKAQFDLRIAKAEVTALKRKLAGKLPPRESRAATWQRLSEEAVERVEHLIDYQQEIQEAKDGQPDNLQDAPFAQRCDAICDIDLEGALNTLQEAESAEMPRGFGRD